jgi:hypothetical protein
VKTALFVQIDSKEEISCRALLSTTPQELALQLSMPDYFFFSRNLLIPSDHPLGCAFGVEEEEGGGRVMEIIAEEMETCQKVYKGDTKK